MREPLPRAPGPGAPRCAQLPGRRHQMAADAWRSRRRRERTVGSGHRPEEPIRGATREQAHLLWPPAGLCSPWLVTQAAEESAPDRPPSPRAAPSGGCSRRQRADPLGGGPEAGPLEQSALWGSGHRAAPGLEKESWPACSRACGFAPPRGGSGLASHSTARILMAPGSWREGTSGRWQSWSPRVSLYSKIQAWPGSRWRPSHPTVPRACWSSRHDAFGQEWVQRPLSWDEVGCFGEGAAELGRRVGLPLSSCWREPQVCRRKQRTQAREAKGTTRTACTGGGAESGPLGPACPQHSAD